MFFFFCKQKTAYEMRISDWSSDVCSSDLLHFFNANQAIFQLLPFRLTGVYCLHERSMDISVAQIAQLFPVALPERFQHHPICRLGALRELVDIRSEEHTSELQSLMRISYAVFCLKKKKNNKQTKHNQRTK